MTNFELLADEVVLYEGIVTSKNYKGSLQLTLTSHKIVLEKEKGIFKKERELVDVIMLETVKFYNNAAQIKQKNDTVSTNAIMTVTGSLRHSSIILLSNSISKAVNHDKIIATALPLGKRKFNQLTQNIHLTIY